MAVKFSYPAPVSWKPISAGVSFYSFLLMEQEHAWHIATQHDQGFSWHIFVIDIDNFSWHIMDQIDQQHSWFIFEGPIMNSSWYLVGWVEAFDGLQNCEALEKEFDFEAYDTTPDCDC